MEDKISISLDPQTLKVLWAAMLAMVHDIHTAQDNLTADEWSEAEGLYDLLADLMDVDA